MNFQDILKDYNPVTDKFILDDLLTQIPRQSHSEAYLRLKLCEAYPTLSQLKKIIREICTETISQIESESVTFAKALVRKMNGAMQGFYLSGGVNAMVAIKWELVAGDGERHFDNRELFAIAGVGVDNKDFYINPDHYIKRFADFFDAKKREKIGIGHAPNIGLMIEQKRKELAT